MANKVTQQQINAVAWQACDTFRGVVDPSEYKNYILVFLFLKYMSDVWKDKKAIYEEKYKGDKERIARAMKRERFVLPDDSSFDHIYEQRNANNIGEIINEALDAIEEANKSKLEGVFRNIDFNSESSLGQTKDRNRRLKNLIEDFAKPEMDLRKDHIGNNDIIGNTYEYLISRFASDAGKKGGEFYTPGEVSVLLAKLMNPQPGNRIYDPACGSGSLLIRVGDEVDSKDFSLYGQESNGSTWALCKMNMFLHGKDNASITWGDTLNNPKFISGDKLDKFDVVIANPPFSLEKWGAESASKDQFNRYWRGVPPKKTGDYAFISH
ncbi:MAG: type I restriction-modification system subunit M, partial [Bacteroidota bacterium]